MDVHMADSNTQGFNTSHDKDALDLRKLLESFDVSKSSGPPYIESSRLLTLILSKHSAFTSLSWQETDHFTDALLGKSHADPSYVQILSHLSDDALQTFLVETAKHYDKPEDIETRYSLVINLCQTFPGCVNDYAVLELSMSTGKILLEEAPRKFAAYCNKHRDRFVTKLLPLMLTSSKKADLLPYFTSHLWEVVRFYMSCLLNTFPDEDFIRYHPDACWQSLFQILSEVWKIGNRKTVRFWSLSQMSTRNLETWWEEHSARTNADAVENGTEFLVTCLFWTFTITRYMDSKTDLESLGRRPFLLCLPGSDEVLEKPSKKRLKLSDRLLALLGLCSTAWDSLHKPEHNSKTLQVMEQLQLEESAIVVSFLCDAAVRDGTPLLSMSETYPFWLQTQILSQQVFQNAKQGLTQSTLDDICHLVQTLRLQVMPHDPREDFSLGEETPRYVWSDHEIFCGCCDIILDHLAKQQLERSSDDTLSVLLTVVQAVATRHISLYQEIISVISTRQKFIFKKFFDYVVLSDMIGEFGALIGKVAFELQMEAPAVAAPVHKTRGANRETTEALHTEFQRHIANCQLNPFQAIQKFLLNEKEVIVRVLFSAGTASLKRIKGASSQ